MLDEIVNKSRPDRVQGLTQARVVPQVGKGRCVHPPLRHCWCRCTRDCRLDLLRRRGNKANRQNSALNKQGPAPDITPKLREISDVSTALFFGSCGRPT